MQLEDVMSAPGWAKEKLNELAAAGKQAFEDAKDTSATYTQIEKAKLEDVEIASDPVKRVLVFPSKNNRTYRAGYVQITAFANDFNLKNIKEQTNEYLVERGKTTRARKPANTFNSDEPAEFLANARKNCRKTRKLPGVKQVFSCILPIPLSISEQTAVEWASTPSGFNDRIVKGAYDADASFIQWGLNTDVGKTLMAVLDKGAMAPMKAFEYASNGKYKADPALATKALYGAVLGTSPISENITGAKGGYHDAAMRSVAGAAVTNPTPEMVALGGNVMNHMREAAAINGRRQIVMDPGYWASFQGVQPRSFELRWTIIPENHRDAMVGLELCARLKEFSLPENVSSVEMLSPHYWNIEFSNPLVQSQLLYGDLVITNISMNFMEKGEIHLSGTPKKFEISITFQEVKAPTAEIFKKIEGSEDLIWGQPTRSAASSAVRSIGTRIIGSGPGGGSNGGGFGGLAGILSGKNPLGKIKGEIGNVLGNIKNQALGAVSNVAGSALGNLAGSISENAGGFVGGLFGDYAGNLVKDTISNSVNSAGSVLTNAIATGDFKDLGGKMGNAALSGATSTVIDAAGEVVGDYVSKATDYAVDAIGSASDAILGAVGLGGTQSEQEAKSKAKEAKAQAEKVKDLKDKLSKIESSNLPDADKQRAREKVEAEFKKAEQLAEAAKQANQKAQEEKKLQEAADKKRKEQEENNKKQKEAESALRELLG